MAALQAVNPTGDPSHPASFAATRKVVPDLTPERFAELTRRTRAIYNDVRAKKLRDHFARIEAQRRDAVLPQVAGRSYGGSHETAPDDEEPDAVSAEFGKAVGAFTRAVAAVSGELERRVFVGHDG